MSFHATDFLYSRADKALRVSFDDGAVYDLPAKLLRVESPSAEVQGHGPGQKIVPQGKDDVAITAIEPVGHYAVRIIFDDGHATGLYTFKYLRDLGDGKRLP
jgi:DUF971 family protein